MTGLSTSGCDVPFCRPRAQLEAPIDPHERIELSFAIYSPGSSIVRSSYRNPNLYCTLRLASLFHMTLVGFWCYPTVRFSFDGLFHASNGFGEDGSLSRHADSVANREIPTTLRFLSYVGVLLQRGKSAFARLEATPRWTR